MLLDRLRLVLRALRRAPGFALAAVACIALGVGANTAIFSAVSAVLLRPVATPAVERLVVARDDLRALDLLDSPVSPPEVLDLAARRDLFAAGGGVTDRSSVVTEGGASARYRGARTIGDFFGAFQVRPLLGRLYRPDDSEDGRHQQAVLAHAFWRERFGGDPGVVGREIRINDQPYTVVGVLPPEFRYPRAAQLYTPYRIDSTFAQARGTLAMTAVLRLRDGVTVEQARAALAGEARAWRARHPQASYGRWDHALRLVPFTTFDAGQLRPVLLVLLGAVALLLLVACANVASLQLVRATARARELTVRAALGASRAAVAGQLLLESAVLAALGGAAGLLLGWGATRLLVRAAPDAQLALTQLRLDAPVLAATLAVVAAVALLGGTLPALRASRVELSGGLREGARGGTAGRARHRALGGIVVGQMALSLVLLLGSGVMLRSLARLLDVDPGFRAERVAAGSVALPFARYGAPYAAVGFYDAVLERLRATPGIGAASLTTELPLALGEPGNSSPLTIVGRDTAGRGEPPHANMLAVGGDYFRTMGIALLRGRTFGPADEARPTRERPVPLSAIVDEELARRYFPGEDPIGRRISQGPDAVIVGVVRSVRQESLDRPLKATVYYHYRQWWDHRYTLVARGTLDDAAAARALRAAVRAVDPQAPLFDVTTLDAVRARSLGARRFGTTVLVAFAAVAGALALVGIYGVLSYAVAQRTREFGVRAALGAGRREMAALVLGRGARLAALGLALGAAAFLALGRVLAAQLHGVTPGDPLTLLVGSLLLGLAALVASWLPARRAGRVDPAVALRAE